MIKYDFDKYINRKNTNCEKHDALKKYFGYENLKGLWVADMDFKTPEFINNEIIKYSKTSIYGYSFQDDDLFESIISWQKNEHDFLIKKDEIFLCTGVVPSYSACIEAFCPNEEDEVIVQTPVYPPLMKCVKDNKRKLILSELKNNNDYYTFDYDDIKSKITKNTKILVLCSPHNPIGRVWDKKELEEIGNICVKNNIVIISDEIHSDLSFKKFIPLASISEEIANITITLNSAGKSFNVAGLNTSYVICKNKQLLNKFKQIAKKRYIHSINSLGLIATKAAYENGNEYINQLKSYLQENIDFTTNFLKQNTKNISFHKPEGTYLLWLNFSNTGLSHNEIKELLLVKCKLALNDGVTFSNNSKCYFRLNVALPKDQLKVALQDLCNFI